MDKIAARLKASLEQQQREQQKRQELIAFSRLYLYVHFPSDILGGTALGVAIAQLTLHYGGALLTALQQKIPF